MAIVFGQELLGSYSMDRFLQRYRDYEYDLVGQLDRRLVDRLMFILEHIWRLMAIIFMRVQLGSCLMGQFQQFNHDCEYGLVVLIGRKLVNRLRFDLVHI